MSAESENKLKELLDRLQVESWQLELLVSGFAIFLTASSFKPIISYGSRLLIISEGISENFGVLPLFASILLASIFFIFVNLILHVVFRGMWISAIGLRSISGEIDFSELKFVAPFDKFMKKRLGSFDNFIQRLEDISSVIFAFTFLLVFMIISFFLFIFFVGMMSHIILFFFEDNESFLFMVTSGLVVMFFGFFGFLYFIDFVTLGFFKRKRWIAIWYYPIYRFFSVITFSWLYRPLYYNLIDNKFGRRVGLFLVPYFVVIGILSSMQASINLYIPNDKDGFEINDRFFEDTREEDKRVKSISIPSKFIKNGYLELFIKYAARQDDKTIKAICPSVKPDEFSGLKTIFSSRSSNEGHAPPDSLLNCVAEIYQVYINDSLYQNLDYYFYKTQYFGEEGLKTIVDLQQLPRGKYILRIDRMTVNSKDSTYFSPYVQTPLWLE